MIYARDESDRGARGQSPLWEAIRRRARCSAWLVGGTVFVAMLCLSIGIRLTAYRLSGRLTWDMLLGYDLVLLLVFTVTGALIGGGTGAIAALGIDDAQEERRAGKASVGLAKREPENKSYSPARGAWTYGAMRQSERTK